MRTVLGLALLAALAGTAFGQGKAADYLTADGKLKHTLEVSTLQSGFAGVTGEKVVVEPDGAWKLLSVFNRKETEKKSGKLDGKQLQEIAAALALYDFDGLPAKSGPARPMANPASAVIQFGKRKDLTMGAGETLPRADGKEPKKSVVNRYAGIVQTVRGMISDAKK